MGITELIAAEATASEANMDAELKPGTTLSRGHGRARTLQIRLNDDELDELTALAAQRGIPVSTLARELLMSQMHAGDQSPQAVIARLRSDLDALASAVA